jgi:hypothetical protein
LARAQSDEAMALRAALAEGAKAVEGCVDFILAKAQAEPAAAFAGAVPFLKLMGVVAGGWQMARAALAAERRLAAGEGDASFLRAKLATARFYAEHVLAQAPALARTATSGAAAVMALEDEQFLAA